MPFSFLCPQAFFFRLVQSVVCTGRQPPLLGCYRKSTIVICHISGPQPVGMTQIDGSIPSVSPVCQMAGGLQSPDIHQCLAVRCSHSSALTLGLVQQTIVSFALPWGLQGLGVMMPPNEVPSPGSSWKFGQYGTAFLYSCATLNEYAQGKNVTNYVDTKFLCSCIFKACTNRVKQLCSVLFLPKIFYHYATCKNHNSILMTWLLCFCHGCLCSSTTTTSVHKCTSKREKQSSH